MYLTHKEYKEFLNTKSLNFVNHAPKRYFCSGNLSGNGYNRKKNVVRIFKWCEEKGSKITDTFAKVTHFKQDFSKEIRERLLEDLKSNPPKDKKEAYELLGKRLSEEDNFIVYEAKIELIDSPEEVSTNILYPDYHKYLEEWHGLDKDKETGRYGYWRNPNAKWDWYVLGGRWNNSFILKDGSFSDQAKKGDIDFEEMEKVNEKKLNKNWKEAKKEKNKVMQKMIYGIEEGDTLESYVESQKKFSTFALLKEGQWYEKASMGWWGLTTNTNEDWYSEFDKLLKELPENTLLSVYDCHI